MKKTIAILVLCVVLLGSLGTVAFSAATNITGTNLTIDFYQCVDRAFYMYYHPQEPRSSQCWASTEISVSSDMNAFAQVNITGIDESFKAESSSEKINGYIKTNAAIVNVSYAKRHRHTGFRKLNGTFLGEWDYIVT